MKFPRPIPGTPRFHLHTIKAVVIWASVWMVIGCVLVAVSGKWPKTWWGWVLWSGAAPIIAAVTEAIGAGLGFVFSRIPPFSWLARWLRCEDGVGDPLLRFVALAFGLLVLFFVAIHIIYDYP